MSFAFEIPDGFEDAIVERVLTRLRRPQQRFLSKRALAEYLGVSERRVKTLREKGLPARRIGRDLYFDVGEVNRWLDREGVASVPPSAEV